MPHGPDPGAQQMRRRMDRAAGEDDLLRPELLRLALHHGAHPDAAHALEQKLADLRLGRDGQVGALPRLGIEIADRGRDPLLAADRDGDGEVAVAEGAVLVGQVRVAGLLEGLGGRLGMRRPVLLRDPHHRDAAILAVEFVVDVKVALDLAEIGQHAVPVPAVGTARLPFVVVGRRAAIGHLAVDRGAAAEHAGLLVLAQRRPLGLWVVVADDLGVDLQVGPVEARVEIGDARIGIEDLLRHLAGRRVLPGFEQQHAIVAARREPVGEHRAGRAAAHDDVAVVHYLPPKAIA